MLAAGAYWWPVQPAERPIPMNAVNRWKVLSQVHSALARGEPRHNTEAIRKRMTARSGESAPCLIRQATHKSNLRQFVDDNS